MNEPKSDAFAVDVKAIRARARASIEEGAVTPGYRGDRSTLLRVLAVPTPLDHPPSDRRTDHASFAGVAS